MPAITEDMEALTTALAKDVEAVAAAAAKGRVAVFKTASGYRVCPAYVVVGRGASVRFVNLTTQPVEVFVPDVELYPNQVFTLSAGEARELPIPQLAAPARFPYAVFSHAARDFVVGDSAPEIIVDQ